MTPQGYHNAQIARGVYGETSKIQEELHELEDAARRGIRIMVGCELADLYGALRAYADRQGFTMKDLEIMANVTHRVFTSGYRSSR